MSSIKLNEDELIENLAPDPSKVLESRMVTLVGLCAWEVRHGKER